MYGVCSKNQTTQPSKFIYNMTHIMEHVTKRLKNRGGIVSVKKQAGYRRDHHDMSAVTTLYR